MSEKQRIATRLRTTMGELENPGKVLRCRSCRKSIRVKVYQPSLGKMSATFGSLLCLFGASWPGEVAAACCLQVFGQSVSDQTIFDVLAKEKAHRRPKPFKKPEQVRICGDGILVRGRKKRKRLEAKVLTVYSATEGKKKTRVLDKSFVVSGIRSWREMKEPLEQELKMRGCQHIRQVKATVCDGAEGICHLMEQTTPGVLNCLDEYHLRKKISTRCEEQFEPKDAEEVCKEVEPMLKQGDVDRAIGLVLQAWEERPARQGLRDTNRSIDKLIRYLRRHKPRIKAQVKAKEEGWLKGTGVQEKSNDLVCGMRCKFGEMHWTRKGLDHVLQHRVAILEGTHQALM